MGKLELSKEFLKRLEKIPIRHLHSENLMDLFKLMSQTDLCPSKLLETVRYNLLTLESIKYHHEESNKGAQEYHDPLSHLETSIRYKEYHSLNQTNAFHCNIYRSVDHL